MALYDNCEYGLIKSFDECVKSGVYVSGNIDLNSGYANSEYKKYIGAVKDINPREYFCDSFDYVDSEKVFDICLYIVCKLFNDELNIVYDFANFVSTINVSHDRSFLNGVALNIANKLDPSKTILITDIASDNLTCSPIGIVHEFVHYYCRKHKIGIERKKYYEEILSIYGELYTAEILDKEFSFGVAKKSDDTRLETIKWHYFDHPEEINQLKEIIRLMPSSRKIIAEQCPWILSEKEFKKEENYRTQLADSYGIGYLFARYLRLLSLTDEDKVQSKVSDALKGNISLGEMLGYFDIQCKNKSMYEDVKTHIKSLRA